MKYLITFMVFNAVCAIASAEGHGKHRGPPRMELTDEQRTCLESKLGKRDEASERPSREAAEAAFTACGIEKPKHKPGGKKGFRPPPPSEEDGTAIQE